ncbi:hypothetical protein CSB37_00365 [bacterium DOLZORAL124_38_8]|nr:MAG: hypothetical protein CSB37_00365 [bacterium DOLZORAL124_38_8]
MKQYTELFKWFQHAQKILLVGTKDWNQDQMSAMVALQQYLQLEGKTVSLVNETKPSKAVEFLSVLQSVKPQIGHKNDFVLSIDTSEKSLENLHHIVKDGRVEIIIRGDKNPFSNKDISFKKSAESFDLIVSLGAINQESIGTPYTQNKLLFRQTPVINISNNITTESFAKFNLIQPQENSLCEILYNFFTQKKIPITPDMSTAILTGIIDQSDSFLSENTPAESLKRAGKLQKIGANQSVIIENLYKKKSFTDLKTLGRILNNLVVAESHKLSWSVLKQNDFKSLHTTAQNIDHWSDQVLRHTNNANISCLFVEQEDDSVLIQVRSRSESFNFENTLEAIGPITTRRFGVDIISQLPLETVQEQVLSALKQYQETFLHLPEQTFEFQKIETHYQPNTPVKQIRNAANNIPFEMVA